MLRNSEKFEKGHYYVYTGWKKLDWVEPKNSVSEHKICKCLDVWNEDLKQIPDNAIKMLNNKMEQYLEEQKKRD